MKILVLNSGSSSQKSSLYEVGAELPEAPPEPVWEAAIDWNGDRPQMWAKNSRGATLRDRVGVDNRRQAVERMLDTLFHGSARAIATASEIDLVGHRIVHGGHKYTEPTAVTSDVKMALTTLATIAPLHNRAELDGIEIIEKLFGPKNAIHCVRLRASWLRPHSPQ